MTELPLISVYFLYYNYYRWQWSSGKTLDCGVLGPMVEAHRGFVFITTTTVIYSFVHGLCTSYCSA